VEVQRAGGRSKALTIASFLVPGPKGAIASVSSETATFEILDGVRRAKAADLLGNTTIPGQVVSAEGVLGSIQNLTIDQLLSPRETIDVSTNAATDRFMSIMNATKQAQTYRPFVFKRATRVLRFVMCSSIQQGITEYDRSRKSTQRILCTASNIDSCSFFSC